MLYNYEDVVLYPTKSSVAKSRSHCDTSVQLGNRTFELPVVPANMKSVVDAETCLFLASKGVFYVMHRFDIDLLAFCDLMKSNNQYVSISIGINGDAEKTITLLKEAKIDPEYITLDVANAWSQHVEPFVKKIKDSFSSFLIVGNLATPEGVKDVTKWGADALKCGIGGGACFRPDSLILTSRGKKRITDVKTGDLVFTANNRLRKVTNTYSRQEKEKLMRINGINCTANHEFYVIHKKYRSVLSDDNIHQYAEWMAANKLNKDYLIININ